MKQPSKKELFSFIDLTSLNTNDTIASTEKLVSKALNFNKKGFNVAAICVFPNYTAIIKDKTQNTTLKTAAVGACFPSSQSFLQVKQLECELAVRNGADEVDVVLNLGAFEEENYDAVVSELSTLKKVVAPSKLKVILETGLLESPQKIKKAAELAISGGADFLKTSTGKVAVGATPEAAVSICEVIKSHYAKTGHKIGFKVSGGVRTYEDALNYYKIVHDILGATFLTPDYFRIGASSLAEALYNE